MSPVEWTRKQILVLLVSILALAVASLAISDYVDRPSKIDRAAQACGFGLDTADAGHTLHMQTETVDPVNSMSAADFTCLAQNLQMPSRVSDEISRTTSLMGLQSDQWDGIKASWTYHPDNGLDLILTDNQ